VRLAHKNGSECFRNSFGCERLPAGEHLVEDATKRKKVAALIGGMSLRLFGRHIAGVPRIMPPLIAAALSSVGEIRCDLRRLCFERLGESEVQDFDLALGSDLHICRLQIAM